MVFRWNLISVGIAVFLLFGTFVVGQEAWSQCEELNLSGMWESSGSCGACPVDIDTTRDGCCFSTYCKKDGGRCTGSVTGDKVEMSCVLRGETFPCYADIISGTRISGYCDRSEGRCLTELIRMLGNPGPPDLTPEGAPQPGRPDLIH
jgi:hypothetical protein